MGDSNSSEVTETDKRENKGSNEPERPHQRQGEDQENGSGNCRMGKLLPNSEGRMDNAKTRWNGAPPTANGDMETMENTPTQEGESTETGGRQKSAIPMGQKQHELLPNSQ